MLDRNTKNLLIMHKKISPELFKNVVYKIYLQIKYI